MARKKKKKKKRRASSTKSRSKATKNRDKALEAQGDTSAENAREKNSPKELKSGKEPKNQAPTAQEISPQVKKEKGGEKDSPAPEAGLEDNVAEKKTNQTTLQSSEEIGSPPSPIKKEVSEPSPGVPLVAPPPSGNVVTGIPIENTSSEEATDRHLQLEAEAVWVLQPALRKVQKKSSSGEDNDLAPKAGVIGGETKVTPNGAPEKNAALSVDFGGNSPSVLVDEDYQKMASSVHESEKEGSPQRTPPKKGDSDGAQLADPDDNEATQKVERLPMEGEFSKHPNRDNTPLAVPLTKGQSPKDAPPGALVIPDLPDLGRAQKAEGESTEKEVSTPRRPPPEAAPKNPHDTKQKAPPDQNEMDTAPQKKLSPKKKSPEGVVTDPPPPPPPAPWKAPKRPGQDLTRLDDSDRKVAPEKKLDDTGEVLLVHPSPFPVAEDSSKKTKRPQTPPPPGQVPPQQKQSQKGESTVSGPRLKKFLTRKLDENLPPPEDLPPPPKETGNTEEKDEGFQEEARALEDLLVSKALGKKEGPEKDRNKPATEQDQDHTAAEPDPKDKAKAVSKTAEPKSVESDGATLETEKHTSSSGVIQASPSPKGDEASEATPKQLLGQGEEGSLRKVMADNIHLDMENQPAPPASTGIQGEVLELQSPGAENSVAPKNAFSDLENAFFEQDLEPEPVADDFEDLFGPQQEPQSVWGWIKSKTVGQPPKGRKKNSGSTVQKKPSSSGKKSNSGKKSSSGKKPNSKGGRSGAQKEKGSPKKTQKGSKKKSSKKK